MFWGQNIFKNRAFAHFRFKLSTSTFFIHTNLKPINTFTYIVSEYDIQCELLYLINFCTDSSTVYITVIMSFNSEILFFKWIYDVTGLLMQYHILSESTHVSVSTAGKLLFVLKIKLYRN